MKLRTLLIAAAGLAIAGGAAGAASAATPWQVHHTRRVEVNHRLTHLNHKIRVERREGRITPAKAHVLHARAHTIRRQEQRMASRDGGHVTRGEQARLNHEETGVRSRLPG